jgi:hypothetical protein
MPAMKYLRFYLDRECVIVPGWGTTKTVRSGCDRWTVADTQRNPDMLQRNAKVLNGTGGLLILDVDPKNGGSLDALRRRFPDLPVTRTVQTVTPHPDGFGTHLIFTIPALAEHEDGGCFRFWVSSPATCRRVASVSPAATPFRPLDCELSHCTTKRPARQVSEAVSKLCVRNSRYCDL